MTRRKPKATPAGVPRSRSSFTRRERRRYSCCPKHKRDRHWLVLQWVNVFRIANSLLAQNTPTPPAP